MSKPIQLQMTQKKTFALITGCGAGGIGESLAKEFVGKGVTPIATILPGEARDHLVAANIDHFDLDVTNEESIKALRKHVIDMTGGKLDYLVNNAGIAYTMTAIDTDVAEVQKMFNINLFGPMRMVHHFHDLLIQAQGTIINIGSVAGLCPYPFGSSYNASKAALHHWGNSIRVELAPLGVHVLTIISGEIRTNILKNDWNRTLPADSFYAPMADDFRAHVQRTPNTSTPHAYAKGVVAKAMASRKPAWFWIGAATGITRFLDIFGFRTAWDWVLWRWFDFKKLRTDIQRRRNAGTLGLRRG